MSPALHHHYSLNAELKADCNDQPGLFDAIVAWILIAAESGAEGNLTVTVEISVREEQVRQRYARRKASRRSHPTIKPGRALSGYLFYLLGSSTSACMLWFFFKAAKIESGVFFYVASLSFCCWLYCAIVAASIRKSGIKTHISAFSYVWTWCLFRLAASVSCVIALWCGFQFGLLRAETVPAWLRWLGYLIDVQPSPWWISIGWGCVLYTVSEYGCFAWSLKSLLKNLAEYERFIGRVIGRGHREEALAAHAD